MALIGAGAVAVAVAAGLLVWQPWKPSPIAPASVSGSSPTGDSIRLTWPAPTGGAAVDHYVIWRDGKQVALVPAATRTWTDTSVQPGDQYTYGIATAGGGTQSSSSPTIKVTTLTPPPTGLTVTSTYSSAILAWKAPANAPTPTSYVVYNDNKLVTTITGSSTSYTQSSQQPGTPYQYAVLAEWGSHTSHQTTPVTGSTRAAPLSGNGRVSVTLTTTPPGSFDNPTVGKAYTYAWTFHPTCGQSSCTIVAYGIIPSDAAGTPLDFTTTLGGSDASGYSGTAQGHFTSCGSQSHPNDDTLTLQLSPVGSLRNGAWTTWKGTLTDDAARNDIGGGQSCAAEAWGFTLQSAG